MKILALGDVVGERAVGYLQSKLRAFKRSNGIDLTVINGENSAKNNGIDPTSANALLDAGADVITTGNHVYRINAFNNYLDTSDCVIRPANFPSACPGKGYTVFDMGYARVLVINVLGTVTLEPLACPFEAVERILEAEKGNYNVSVLDVHAEATSEKAAIARYFDGRINVVFGTHTHVQTNDARILPKGTGFITDLGMCGPTNSILGVKSEIIIEKLRYHMPKRFEFADGEIEATGAIFTVENGKTIDVTAVRF